MKVAIMQPYFLPYIGYFSLIKHTDLFIFFDTIQYIRHGWIDRNRILKPGEGWQYIKVPIKKHSRETAICDLIINNDIKWKTKILAQIQHYKKRAPFYDEVSNILENVFSNEYSSIVSLNYDLIKKILQYLGLSSDMKIFSKMNLSIAEANAPDEWALNICKSVGNVDEYWNPPGGKEFFDRNKYVNNSITLRFHEINLSEYNQRRKTFESGLSIVDVLMYNSPEVVNQMLDDYRLS